MNYVIYYEIFWFSVQTENGPELDCYGSEFVFQYDSMMCVYCLFYICLLNLFLNTFIILLKIIDGWRCRVFLSNTQSQTQIIINCFIHGDKTKLLGKAGSYREQKRSGGSCKGMISTFFLLFLYLTKWDVPPPILYS